MWFYGDLMGFYGDLMGIYGIYWDLPSGEHTKSYGKIHPFFMGKYPLFPLGHFPLLC